MIELRLLFTVVLLSTLLYPLIESSSSCSSLSCPRPVTDKINVHIVAHTHDDVGWLKTVDQYYYGTAKRYSPIGVRHILDSVMPQLALDPEKRFVYAEMSFFAKWWDEQEDATKQLVIRLVQGGQLEFINGGWCMNDEATVNYQSVIEQMTLGLKFINDNFGSCVRPKVGWQIDPFGHSNEQASLFAQFGFDGMYFTRIGHLDKEQRIRNKSLDLIWHGDRMLSGQSGSIFTNIFRNFYDSPAGFCFDVYCFDDELVDNKKSYEYNIERKGNIFIEYARKYATVKLTNNILIPIGGDFHFSAAGQNFKNLDKLIKYIRAQAPDLNIFYSTPSCYQREVLKSSQASGIWLPEKYDDFMPYDSTPTVWWSGYFSSRPSVKLVERETANLLQAARLVSVEDIVEARYYFGIFSDVVMDDRARCLNPLWEILADMQHHDAVTGTEKQHVTDDYLRRASDAATQCAKFMGDRRRSKLNENLIRSPNYELHKKSLADKNSTKLSQLLADPIFLESTQFCPLLNISECSPIESEIDYKRYLDSATGNLSEEMPSELRTRAVLINVYNPLARPISQHDIRLPCSGICDLNKVKVIHLSTNRTMRLIKLPLPAGLSNVLFRGAVTTYELLFYADILALGHTSFVLEDLNDNEKSEEMLDEKDNDEASESSEAAAISEPMRSCSGSCRRLKRQLARVDSEESVRSTKRYDYFTLRDLGGGESVKGPKNWRLHRRSNQSSVAQPQQPSSVNQVIVKFDLSTGMIVGLKRQREGSFLNVSQKFGYYFPANADAQPGAYIFRPNSSEPKLFDKPIRYQMYKRKGGALVEIHQKWADWLWQTIRVDAKKNYIEFDYVVGPIPIDYSHKTGREVVTRYITNMANEGVFMTDSNGRQLMTRQRVRSTEPEELGGSFFPVVSTILLRNTGNLTKASSRQSSAETVAVLVDRAQAGTSLRDGQLELLIHRRHLKDDNWGVGEALDEAGEDGRGLVTRGKHRLYLKFRDSDSTSASAGQSKKISKSYLIKLPETPKSNLTYEEEFYNFKEQQQSQRPSYVFAAPTYIVHDQVYNDLRQESIKFAMKPILTFDRLRVSASEFISDMFAAGNNSIGQVKTDLELMNTTLPNNVHLLTLQPWTTTPRLHFNSTVALLIRLENLDNPLTLHPYPNPQGYQGLVRSYRAISGYHELDSADQCAEELRPRVEVDIEYLLKEVRIFSLEELNLGANSKLEEDGRLNWTDESYDRKACESSDKPTVVKLAPRQIRTFLAEFEPVEFRFAY